MIEKIETDRCVLRKVSVDDAAAIFSTYAQDDDVVRYLDWAKHQSVQETIDFLVLCQEWWDVGKEYSFAILNKKT
jgi:[ribosomal protein S5]-alanine N-acetyltransferase